MNTIGNDRNSYRQDPFRQPMVEETTGIFARAQKNQAVECAHHPGQSQHVTLVASPLTQSPWESLLPMPNLGVKTVAEDNFFCATLFEGGHGQSSPNSASNDIR